MKTKIAIADDHRIFSDGLKSLLESKFEILFTASTGAEVIKKLEVFDPEVLLLDVNLPELNGLEVLLKLKKMKTNVKPIMLTMYGEPYMIQKCKAEGALGYLLKNTSGNVLIEAVQQVAEGKIYYSPKVQEILNSVSDKELNRGNAQISKREKEIIEKLAQGYNTAEIAEMLFISIHTVDTHRRNLLGKLQVSNTVSLVKFATDNGLI